MKKRSILYYILIFCFMMGIGLFDMYLPIYSLVNSPNISGVELNPSSWFVFSTYFGGEEWEYGTGIATDEYGNCYITGQTFSANFPTKNALYTIKNGFRDIFLTKFNPSGSVNFSTFFGGSSDESGGTIKIDGNNSIIITGSSISSDYPILNAYSAVKQGDYDVILTKFNSDLSLNFSTYLGGSGTDYGYKHEIDNNGVIYVVGITYSSDFPLLNPFDSTYGGDRDVFVAKFNPDGSLNFSSYLGGSDWDSASSIAIDNSGACYISGTTFSSDFPLLNAYDTTLGVSSDAFLTKLNPDGSLNFSTYLGSDGQDGSSDVEVTQNGIVYLIGNGYSEEFPILDPYGTSSDNGNIFIAQFSTSGDLLFSTLIGGLMSHPAGSCIDDSGSLYFTGRTYEPSFATWNAYDRVIALGEAFYAKINLNGSLNFCCALGGNDEDEGFCIDIDSNGLCYVIGETGSVNLPLENEYNSTVWGGFDAFICKMYPPMDDNDEDGILNYWEYREGMNSNNASDASLDYDQDGLSNLEEFHHNTDPWDEDSDNDGFSDFKEVKKGTDPNNRNDHPLQIDGYLNWIIFSLIGISVLVWRNRFHKKKSLKINPE